MAQDICQNRLGWEGAALSHRRLVVGISLAARPAMPDVLRSCCTTLSENRIPDVNRTMGGLESIGGPALLVSQFKTVDTITPRRRAVLFCVCERISRQSLTCSPNAWGVHHGVVEPLALLPAT